MRTPEPEYLINKSNLESVLHSPLTIEHMINCSKLNKEMEIFLKSLDYGVCCVAIVDCKIVQNVLKLVIKLLIS